MNRYRTVLVLNIAVFIMMVGVGMVVALLPAKMIAFTGSSSSVGYLAAVFAAAYLLFQIPTGRLADKIGFRLLIGSGFVICGISGILYCRAESGVTLLVGRMLQGFGEVPVWALAPAALSMLYPEQKGRVMGLYNASFHFGLSVGPVTGILLERILQSPKTPFHFYIAASFAGGLLIWLLAENPVRSSHEKKREIKTVSLKKLLSGKRIRVMLAGVMLYGVGYGFLVTSIPAYLITVKRFTSTEVGFYFTFFYIAISVVQLTVGPFSDKYGRSGSMIGGLFLSFFGIVFFSSFDKTASMGMLIASSSGLGMFYVASIAHLDESVGANQKGTISGLYFFAWGAGYFLGPLLAGICGKYTGMEVCFQFYGCLLLLETALMVIWRNG